MSWLGVVDHIADKAASQTNGNILDEGRRHGHGDSDAGGMGGRVIFK